MKLVSAIALAVFSQTLSVHAAESCARESSRQFVFSNEDALDTAVVRIIGDDCTKAIVVRTIYESKGYVIYTDSEKLISLSAGSLDNNDPSRVVESIWAFMKPRSAGELPYFDSEDIDPENFWTGGEENRDNYESAREANARVVCFQFGIESWQCYWRDPKVGVRLLYGFGA